MDFAALMGSGLGQVLGGTFGAVARLAPEVLAHLDKKNERKHELAMLTKQMEVDAKRADLAMNEVRLRGEIEYDNKGLDVLLESVKAQGQPTGVGWVDALNKSVRPVLTYWWALVLYSTALAAQFALLVQSGVPAVEAVTQLWGAEEKAIVSSLFAFWFLDRVLRHSK